MKILLLTLFMTVSHITVAKTYKFPQGFEWCAATSSYQIEGDNKHSDWWKFEQDVKIERSGKATNHWEVWKEDFNRLQDLGVKTYRMSIEWGRVFPVQGKVDQKALDQYKDMIADLRARGIRPMVTIQHFTLPQWLADKGGWESDEVVSEFLNYTKTLNESFGNLVDQWVTVNEPMLYLLGAYAYGLMPPLVQDWNRIGKPVRNLLMAHAKAYKYLKQDASEENRTIEIGFAHHMRILSPNSGFNPIERYLAGSSEQILNWTILDAIKTGKLEMKVPFILDYEADVSEAKGTVDFIGLNYYIRDRIKFILKPPFILVTKPPKDVPKTDMGWEIYPKGIYKLLKKATKKYKLPVYITENGLADAKDSIRKSFVSDHLKEVHRAISEGVQVKGYCYWSFLDNFEWREGYHPRFGLFEVDYKNNFKRTIRPSAAWLGQVFKMNHLTD